MVFTFGASILSFLKYDITQIIKPQIVKRTPANIKIDGMLSVSIENALYPIFMHGNSEPQRAITISDNIIVFTFPLTFIFLFFPPKISQSLQKSLLRRLHKKWLISILYDLGRKTQKRQTFFEGAYPRGL